jgi:hypothetical protein
MIPIIARYSLSWHFGKLHLFCELSSIKALMLFLPYLSVS